MQLTFEDRVVREVQQGKNIFIIGDFDGEAVARGIEELPKFLLIDIRQVSINPANFFIETSQKIAKNTKEFIGLQEADFQFLDFIKFIQKLSLQIILLCKADLLVSLSIGQREYLKRALEETSLLIITHGSLEQCDELWWKPNRVGIDSLGSMFFLRRNE